MTIPPLALNRLCLYLRSLRRLQESGVQKVSSAELAERFNLSAAQIRKDLGHFGEMGIRGVGYDVASLVERLTQVLGLDRQHRVLVVGMGNLGQALARYFGFNHGSFYVVAGVDKDPAKVGQEVAGFRVRHADDLAEVVREERIHVGVVTTPVEAAQENYDRLVEAGVLGVLNFAPTRVKPVPEVPLKDVDLRIYLEELAYSLSQKTPAGSSELF